MIRGSAVALLDVVDGRERIAARLELAIEPPPGAKGTTLARIGSVLGDGSYAPTRAAAERAADVLRDKARYPEAAAAYRLVLAVTTEPAARARLEASLAGVAARTP